MKLKKRAEKSAKYEVLHCCSSCGFGMAMNKKEISGRSFYTALRLAMENIILTSTGMGFLNIRRVMTCMIFGLMIVVTENQTIA